MKTLLSRMFPKRNVRNPELFGNKCPLPGIKCTDDIQRWIGTTYWRHAGWLVLYLGSGHHTFGCFWWLKHKSYGPPHPNRCFRGASFYGVAILTRRRW